MGDEIQKGLSIGEEVGETVGGVKGEAKIPLEKLGEDSIQRRSGRVGERGKPDVTTVREHGEDETEKTPENQWE